MIKINLTPEVELESSFWWAQSAAIVAVLAIIGYGYTTYVQMGIQEQRKAFDAEVNEIQSKFDTSSGGIEEEIKKLNEVMAESVKKLKVLRDFTGKKVERFRPLLIMDILQVIKPQGVWITVMEINGGTVKIQGASFDNMLLAEFLTNLKATAAQKIQATDIRTNIFFMDMDLQYTRQNGQVQMFPDIGMHYQFSVNFNVGTLDNESAKVPSQMPGQKPNPDPKPPGVSWNFDRDDNQVTF